MVKRRNITTKQPTLPLTAEPRPTSGKDKAANFHASSRDDAYATGVASNPGQTCLPVNIRSNQALPVCNRPMDSSFDLPDSTDWIKTSLPTFEPLEAALRCEVCKEFYHNPVITPCSHTFCSICIRRCIATDGKCPSCKTGCSSDKLLPNIAVREVVMRFQEARPKALELARADKDEEVKGGRRKKRKMEDTDIEEDENVRHTRSRQTRSKNQRNGDRAASPAVVADSEDDGDEDFVPDGMVKCPVCNRAMKEELVYNHLDTCTGPNASPRNTRSRKPAFPVLQARKKDPSPPPIRLSQLNYAMMKETALRKKLQEIGIPNWGTKDLMRRRHIEWINIFNSNCDAHDSLRKSHRQLLKELDEWEQTQGGRSNNKESAIMKKDFDGEGYAKSHRTEFDDLIARARQKRATPKTDDEERSGQDTPADGQRIGSRNEITANGTDGPSQEPISNHASPGTHLSGYDPHNPYEDGQSAPATMPAKGEAANSMSPIHTLKSDNSMQGKEIPLGSPSRQVPIYAVPEEPVRDMEGNAAVQ